MLTRVCIILRENSPTEAWRNLEVWHNPTSVTAIQTLRDHFQWYSMKPWQNPLEALTDLEGTVAQISQQRFFMTPEQPLIQFIAILLQSDFEVEKRTFCNERNLDREQILLAIRSRYENLQVQQGKYGREKNLKARFRGRCKREIWWEVSFSIWRWWSLEGEKR